MYMLVFCILFALFYLPITIFYPTKIIHKERVPKKKKAIVTCNHYSNLDPIIINIKFHSRFMFLAKIELFKNGFMKWFMKCLGAIPVNREKVAPSTFKEVLSTLKQNKRVFIFPEGTRNKSGSEEMGDAKSGVITFASKGDAEIVPMLMHKKPKFLRKNYIIVGEPFKVEGENPSRLTKEEIDANLEKYTKIMDELRLELDTMLAKKNKKKNKKK